MSDGGKGNRVLGGGGKIPCWAVTTSSRENQLRRSKFRRARDGKNNPKPGRRPNLNSLENSKSILNSAQKKGLTISRPRVFNSVWGKYFSFSQKSKIQI